MERDANVYCATVKAVFKIGGLVKVVSIGDGFAALTSDGIGLLPGTELRLTEDIEREISGDHLLAALTELLEDISNFCLDDKTLGSKI